MYKRQVLQGLQPAPNTWITVSANTTVTEVNGEVVINKTGGGVTTISATRRLDLTNVLGEATHIDFDMYALASNGAVLGSNIEINFTLVVDIQGSNNVNYPVRPLIIPAEANSANPFTQTFDLAPIKAAVTSSDIVFLTLLLIAPTATTYRLVLVRERLFLTDTESLDDKLFTIRGNTSRN